MSKSTTISGTVTRTVSLGTGGIASTLIVTGTGLVLPEVMMGNIGSYGDIGVEVRAKLTAASITNMGTISGGAGGYQGVPTYVSGGIGVNVSASNTTISNTGLIIGGQGAYVLTYHERPSLFGGIGIDLTGTNATVTNQGTILGGAGGDTGEQVGGTGGIGIQDASDGSLVNSGIIQGGAGGSVYDYSNGGVGGVGVNLAAANATLENHGAILGGAGGMGGYDGEGGYYAFRGARGIGVEMAHGTYLSNTGTIGGNIGIDAQNDSIIINTGMIFSRESASGPSRTPGVAVGGSTELTNQGTIQGGSGYQITIGQDYQYAFIKSGDGVDVTSDATVSNSGLILAGGDRYYGGASGVDLMAGGTLTNSGTIVGGYGVNYGGSGVLATNAVLSNAGLIDGGQRYGTAGAGLAAFGGISVNTGTIEGGSFSEGFGAGVYLRGSTFTNAGTVVGNTYFGQTAYSVLAQAGSTLVVDPGAVFIGVAHAGSGGGSNTLELAGTSAGTLADIGTDFTGFQALREVAGANWTLAQSNTLGDTESLSDAGLLTVAGTLTGGITPKITVGGEIRTSSGGTILIANLGLFGGVLAGSPGGSIAIGSDAGGLSASHIIVETGAAISGYGAINGANEVIDNGIIIARGGTLTVGIPVTGTGALDIANGATLQIGGAVNVASVKFESGTNETLYVAKPSALSSTINGFGANDKIDLKGVIATTLTFLANTLTLYNGNAAVDSLTFSGHLAQADFIVKSDGAGGTDILYGGSAAGACGHLDSERPALPILSHHTGTWT